jgi:Fic family protein
MRVVSGPLDHPKVHYVAPPGERAAAEMQTFLAWWAASHTERPDILRAGLAHLWFVAIHPFEDGNGRIGRALAEMALAQAEKQPVRFYSLSAEIMRERNGYYDILERTNRGNGDITEWQLWFLAIIGKALAHSRQVLENVLAKSQFWQAAGHIILNDRQRKVVSRMLEGFEGGMTTRKYKGLAHTSPATAQRELADLLKKGLLLQTPGTAGRNVSYQVNWGLGRIEKV